MKIPYGNADFYRLVTQGYVYVDRTAHISRIEEMGDALLFLRPRRFGKSLWLRTLACYYDLRYGDEHDALFGHLAAGRPRPEGSEELAHRYFVLQWDFSAIAPELSPGESLGSLLNGYVNRRISSFLSDYRDHLPPSSWRDRDEVNGAAVENLDALLALIRQTPYRLCLLVDEYDNFANEVMLNDLETYKGLVRADGPLRALMKWVKQEYRAYPHQLLDANLAMDENKLTYLAREVPGQQVVMDVLQSGRPIEVRGIVNRFSISDMLAPEGHDQTYLGSFLYYFGMLTLQGGWTDRRRLLLDVPNLVTQSLYIDHVRRLLLAGEKDPRAPEEPSVALVGEGDVRPLARYVEEKVFRRFSNLDYRWMNELAVKTAFLALLFNDVSHMIFSEPELDRDRADLCLLRRPDARTNALWDVLLEFKYLKLAQLPGRPSGKELRARSDDELLAFAPVADAFADATAQLTRYRDVLAERLGDDLRLRCFAVVALGFERLLVREVP